MTPARRPPRPRRSIARETPEEKYRRAALELAHLPNGDGLPEAPFLVARVAFSDVAGALGITRPALYRLWPSQYDFWVDLSRYIASEVNYAEPDYDRPWNAPRGEMLASPVRLADHEVDAVMTQRANASQDAAFADIRVVIRAASLGYRAVHDLGDIRRAVETARHDVFVADLAKSLAVIGRAADDRGLGQMAASLWCIAEGLSLLNRVDPESCSQRYTVDFGDGPHSWTLLALATRALYYGLSAPADVAADLPSRPPPYEVPEPPQDWGPLHIEALETATQLFIDSITDPATFVDGQNVLGHVTVARVAALAGVSRRTIYNVWPTRGAMMSVILDELLARQRRTQRTVLDTEPGLARVTDTLAGPPGEPVPHDPALAYLIELGNESQRSVIADAYWYLAADLSGHLDEHLRSARRAPRSGITTDELGLLWLALVQAGRRLRRACPTIDADFGAAFESVVHELTVEA